MRFVKPSLPRGHLRNNFSHMFILFFHNKYWWGKMNIYIKIIRILYMIFNLGVTRKLRNKEIIFILKFTLSYIIWAKLTLIHLYVYVCMSIIFRWLLCQALDSRYEIQDMQKGLFRNLLSYTKPLWDTISESVDPNR